MAGQISCHRESDCMSSIFRVCDQNGISPLYIIVEIYHSGWKPSIFSPRTALSGSNRQKELSVQAIGILHLRDGSAETIVRAATLR